MISFENVTFGFPEKAFIIFTEGTSVTGHFETRLEA